MFDLVGFCVLIYCAVERVPGQPTTQGGPRHGHHRHAENARQHRHLDPPEHIEHHLRRVQLPRDQARHEHQHHQPHHHRGRRRLTSAAAAANLAPLGENWRRRRRPARGNQCPAVSYQGSATANGGTLVLFEGDTRAI